MENMVEDYDGCPSITVSSEQIKLPKLKVGDKVVITSEAEVSYLSESHDETSLTFKLKKMEVEDVSRKESVMKASEIISDRDLDKLRNLKKSLEKYKSK